MASNTNAPAASLPHLNPGEVVLLNLADDDPRDVVSLSDKEALILQLYNRIQEQALEREFLKQKPELSSGNDVEKQLAIAEHELLEARATYTVRKKAVGTILMTDPTLKAVHMKATSPPERDLLGLINRRDVLSLAHENLAAAHDLTLKDLSNMEIENLRTSQKNRDLVTELLSLTSHDSTWKEKVKDSNLKDQLEELEADQKKIKAKWETMKSIASAVVVGSGVNWAGNETLEALVLDEEDD